LAILTPFLLPFIYKHFKEDDMIGSKIGWVFPFVVLVVLVVVVWQGVTAGGF